MVWSRMITQSPLQRWHIQQESNTRMGEKIQQQTTSCKSNKILPSAKPFPINVSYNDAKFQQNMGWHLVQYLLATFVQNRCRAEQKIRFYCFRPFICKKKKITWAYYAVQLRWGAALWTCCEVPPFPCSLLVYPGRNQQQGRPKVRNMEPQSWL